MMAAAPNTVDVVIVVFVVVTHEKRWQLERCNAL